MGADSTKLTKYSNNQLVKYSDIQVKDTSVSVRLNFSLSVPSSWVSGSNRICDEVITQLHTNESKDSSLIYNTNSGDGITLIKFSAVYRVYGTKFTNLDLTISGYQSSIRYQVNGTCNSTTSIRNANCYTNQVSSFALNLWSTTLDISLTAS